MTRASRKAVAIASFCAVLACLIGIKIVSVVGNPTLPFHDAFVKGEGAEWTPLGGSWQISQGAVFNRSDEAGAKLITGSADWTDYELDSDLKMIGHDGDVGVILRVTGEELGSDSYSGYYVGLRSKDSALVIGRADFGWMEGRPEPVLGGVQIGTWYRLRVVAVGCKIAAEVTNLTTGQETWAAFEEAQCAPHGKIGLRSMTTGGAWRNVQAHTSTLAEYGSIRTHANSVQAPIYPVREDQFNKMRASYFRSTFRPQLGYEAADSMVSGKHLGHQMISFSSIETVTLTPALGRNVVLRGVVTLTQPLFIQDDTGAIEIQSAQPPELNLGDEIQVQGALSVEPMSAKLVSEEIHLLGNLTPVVPLSISPTQAATGAFNGRLVELRGTLRSKSINAYQEIVMQVEDSEQTFRVIGKGDLSLAQYRAAQPGSELRIRGICTAVPWQQSGRGAFTILLRSMDEVEVLTGPPWWSPYRIIWYASFVVVLIIFILHLLIRMERSKMEAIFGERQRIAHDMHDTLAQSFAGVGFHLQGVRNSFRTGTIDLSNAAQKLDVVCDLVTRTHREASAEIAGLHPDPASGDDLLAALERCTHAMLQDHFPSFVIATLGTPKDYSLAVRDAFFQIGREAITNVLRHSQATQIEVKLHYKPKHLELQITDNGGGFDYSEQAQGFGFCGMRRRSEKVGAVLRVETRLGTGTVVSVEAAYGVRDFKLSWPRLILRRNA